MNETKDFALVRRPSSAVEKAAPGAERILSGMVSDTLDLARKTASEEIRAADTQLEGWYRMGEKYWDGLGVPQDCAEAAKWWRKAAEQNYSKAQYDLGLCYYTGEGIEKN